MRATEISRVRQVGSLAAVATFAVAGIAGCAGDNRTQSNRDQSAAAQVDPKRVERDQGAAKGPSAYCSAVETFNEVLANVPNGEPAKVQGSLDTVSAKVGRIVRSAPDNVRQDWKKLRSGFDRLNDNYRLLDGIDPSVLAELQSASTEDEVDAVGLRPADAKKYERFQRKASEISAKVESSGKKVSEQVQRECDISIGE